MSVRQTPRAADSATLADAGDTSAWLDEHGDAMYRYARAQVGHREQAEDLVQDALVAAIQSRDRFQGHATVRTWLLSILRHKIMDHHRRAEKPLSTTLADSVRSRYFNAKGLWKTAVASWKAPDQALEDREFWGVLDGCLRRLPPSLSSVFIMREIDDLDNAELRQILDVSEVNLRVRLHRARLMLRECLEKHWFVETRDGSRRTP